MDKQKRIGWLIGALALLILIAYASGTFDAAPSTVDVPRIEIDADEVNDIVIEQPSVSMHAVRNGGIWQLSEPVQWLADSTSVSAFVRDISSLTLESVVSLNPERYGRYGVDSTGAHVRVGAGDKEVLLVLSAEGPDFSTTYVRIEGDERVFVARPRVSVPSDANRWRDRVVARLPEGAIESVSVSTSGETYSVQRDGLRWMLNESGVSTPADSAAIANWLRTYSSLRADGFLDGSALSDSLVHHVDFSLSGGENQRFTISEQENELAVTYSGEPRATYRFFSSRKNSLLPDVSSLRAGE